MKPRYDIDIVYIMPEEVFDDATHAEMLKQAGIELNSRGNYLAKFRDPKTAAALSGAADEVKAFFEASGFALVPSGMLLPEGQFDARFDNHITDILKRLEENMSKFDLPKVVEGCEAWNGFSFGECLLWFSQSTAVDCSPTTPEWEPAVRRKPFPSYKHIGFLGALALTAYALS